MSLQLDDRTAQSSRSFRRRRCAALDLARDLGVERTTVARIAERADVSPRTVAWFPSKDDIFVGGGGLPTDRLAAELNDGEGDLLDRVRRWANAEGNSRPGPEDLARFRHRVLLGDPHLRALQRAGQQDVEDLIAQTIADESHLPLLDEIARRPGATRQVFTDELMGVIDDIASRLDPTDLAAARTDALAVFGLMVGTCSSPGH